MKNFAARTLRASASIQSSVDLLLGPVVIALALFVSAFIPLPAWAQTSSAAADYQFQRALSKIVSGSGSGLVIRQPGTMNIVNAGKVVGSFALNEKRIIDLATLAKYARVSTVPAVLALAATELLNYGLEKCADGTWCKRDPSATQPGTQPATWVRVNTSTPGFQTAQAACSYWMDYYHGQGFYLDKSATLAAHPSDQNSMICGESFTVTGPATVCPPGTTSVGGGMCTNPTATVPATNADVEAAWKNGFQTNPFIQEKYWGFEDQTKNLQAWADALAQTAEVINGSLTDVRPEEKTTTSAGTTTKQTTCTYTAAGTADKVNPVNVTERCTTTTTAPDGTQTQEITEKTGPQGADKVPPKVEVDTCGLPGKPACKIDETGTPTAQKTETATDTATAMDSAMKQQTDALRSVLDGAKPETNWASWLPQIPRSECKPTSVEAVPGVSVDINWCPAVGVMQTLATVIWMFAIMGGCIAEVKDALNGS